MTQAVVADRISRRYGETQALDSVSLSIERGEVFALVGPNGAGKTTLVRSLTGTTKLTSGSVQILGSPPQDVDRDRIGLLPQSFSPPERLTARELLEYYAGLYDDARSVDGVLEDVGLEADDDTWYVNLSGGQQRRACVGATLVNDPELLFLDEPTTGIDPAGRRSLWSLVSDLADSGTTIFLTTHYMEEAETLADRVGLLDDGSIVETGSPAALIEQFGGGTHLEVETTATGEALEGMPFEIVYTESGIRIPEVAPREIGDVVSVLEDRGVPYETLTWAEPGLEDVYLQLTDEGDGSDATRADGEDANAGGVENRDVTAGTE